MFVHSARFGQVEALLEHALGRLKCTLDPCLVIRVGRATDIAGKVRDRLGHAFHNLPGLFAPFPEVYASGERSPRLSSFSPLTKGKIVIMASRFLVSWRIASLYRAPLQWTVNGQ